MTTAIIGLSVTDWTEIDPTTAAAAVNEIGQSAIWADDGVLGYARLLAAGETEAAALADFEVAGMKAVNWEIIAPTV